MNDKEISTIIARLKKEKDAVILVEGKRDRDALRKRGVRSSIVTISQKKIYDLTLDLVKRKKKIIILTDFDAHGTELFRKYRKELEILGAEIDTYYYTELKFYLKKFISSIEHIDTFLSTHQTSHPYSCNRE
jgi:5S rRNA maturation endonuclease (ribonuclease M5)